ncbi:MAG: thioredoxin family protein [Mariprofundaceae bacterium]|nr:thioredoxin family protein [Mariprofundaceae bacterium]
MSIKQKIEIFSSGCPVCNDAADLINRLACDECEISVLDMHEPKVSDRAKGLGVQSIPAIVLDGTLAACCAGHGVNESSLRAAGLLCPVSA